MAGIRIGFKSQEPRKGGFSKGDFCRLQCHAQGNKNIRALGPAVHLALRAPQPREAYIFATLLLKCDANGPRNVKNTNLGSQESVLRVPKRGQFQAAIRVTTKRRDSCAQGAPERRTVSWRNFCDAESLARSATAKHATKLPKVIKRGCKNPIAEARFGAFKVRGEVFFAIWGFMSWGHSPRESFRVTFCLADVSDIFYFFLLGEGQG